MSLGARIRSGVKWLFIGNTGSQILQFLFGIALARLLVPADFGMIATVSVFTGFVSAIASGGMGQSLIRAKEADTIDFHAVFTMQLALGVAIYATFFIVAPFIGQFFGNPLYGRLLRVSALIFVLRPFTMIHVAWLSREMQFKKRSLIALVSSLLVGSASVAMAAGGMGVWSLTISGLIGALASNAMYVFATPLRPRLRFNRESIRKHAGFGLKITASDVIAHLKEHSVNLVLSKLSGPAFLGLFNKAESLARMPNRLVAPPTGQAVFRAMSVVQDDLDRTRYMLYRTITLLMVYIFPFLVGLWWVAEQFVGVVYGDRWLPIVEPMRIIVLAGVPRTIWIPCGVTLNAQNRLAQMVVGEAIGLVLTIALVIGGLRWGLPGVAWATVASSVFYAGYSYGMVCRAISTGPVALIKAAIPALVLNAFLFAILASAHHAMAPHIAGQPALYLSAMALIGGIAYTLALLFFPIPALRSEADRWKGLIAGAFRRRGGDA
jgi:O-antigen/teichoic acid export membrane protein